MKITPRFFSFLLLFICASTFLTAAAVVTIDTATNTAQTAIPLSSNPDGIAITPDGSLAYVAGNSPSTVTPITLSTNTPGTPFAIGAGLTSIAILPTTGAKGFVGDPAPFLSTFNIPSNTLGALSGYPDPIEGIAILPNGTLGYVTTSGNQVISFSTSGSPSPITTISVGTSPQGIAIDPTGTYAIVANNGSNNVTRIQFPNTTSTLSSGINPTGVAITGNFAYVTNSSDGTVTKFQINPFLVIGLPIPVGNEPTGIAITPNGHTAYVANSTDGTVTPIDLTTITPTPGTPIKVGTNPRSIAITPNGKTVYVTVLVPEITPITPLATAPTSLTGCQQKNVFLTQTERSNIITWNPPNVGSPVAYHIFRDAALTELAGTVKATTCLLEFRDGNRTKCPGSGNTYYVVSVDANGSMSAPAVVTVTQKCN